MDKESHLVDNERLIYTAEGTNDNLYLTNNRVIHTSKKGFFSRNTSFKDIDYRHISSIEYGTISHIWLVILGILLFIVGFSSRDLNILIVVGIIVALLYFVLRKAGIIFITENEKVVFNFSGNNAEKMAKEVTMIIRENTK